MFKISEEVQHDKHVPGFSAESTATHDPVAATTAGALPELRALRDALERLIESRGELADQAEGLRGELALRDQKIKALENEVRDLRQTKRDVAKRIDDLIGQLDHVERDAERPDSAGANV